MLMKITMVQARGMIDDPVSNFFKARMRINNVDSDIFVYPEMSCCGYVKEIKRQQASKIDAAVVNKLKDLSVKRNCAIICGCTRIYDEKNYNTLLFINGNEITEHQKTLLSRDGVFDEDEVFTPGKKPTMVKYKDLTIGLAMGQELYSPELFRYYAEKGADIVICISAFTDRQMDRIEKILPARAVENSMYIILDNMTGNDPGINLAGRSKFVAPDGTFTETFTEGSDVREIMLDEDALIKAKNERKLHEKANLELD